MSRSTKIKREPQPEWTLDDMNQLYQAISYDDGPSAQYPSSQENGGIINMDSDQSRQSVKRELGEPVSMELSQLQLQPVNMGPTVAPPPRAIRAKPQMFQQQSQGWNPTQSQGLRLVRPVRPGSTIQNGVVSSGWMQQLPQQGRALQSSLPSPSGVRMVRKVIISRPMVAAGGVNAGTLVRMPNTNITGNNMITPWSGRPVQIVRSQNQGLNSQAQYQHNGLRLARQPQQTMIRIAPGPIQAANQSRSTYLPTLTAIANETQAQGVMLPRNAWMANQLQQQSRFNFGARQQSCMLSRAWMSDGRGGGRMVTVGHPLGYRGPAPGQPGLVCGQTPIARSGQPRLPGPGPTRVRMTYRVPSVAASSNPGTGLSLAVPSTSRANATAPTAPPKKKTPRPRARKQTYDAAPPPYLCHDVDDSDSSIIEAEDVKPVLPLPGLPMLPWIKPEPQDWQDDHNDDNNDNDWMLTDDERRRKELDDFIKQVKPEPIEGAPKPKRRGRGRKGKKDADAAAADGVPAEPPVPRKRKESTSVAEKIEKNKCPDCGRHPINRRCQKTFHGMFVRYKPHQKGPRHVGVEITEDGKLMLPCPFSDQF